jgi:dolichol kinase
MNVLRLSRDRPAAYIPSAAGLTVPGLGNVKNEALRKAIHFLIAFCPSLAALSLYGTEILLAAGCLIYAWFEIFRRRGINIPVVSALTRMASRPRDFGRFVIGPITLGLGALLVLAFFPPLIAAIAIYALAFGDGFASLVGRIYGRTRPVFLRGKSLEGSFACFVAVFLTAYGVSGNIRLAVIAALTATVIEALPLGDYDNIILPVGVGIVLMSLMH